eukprot:3661252-Rhodomonas_salina.2
MEAYGVTRYEVSGADIAYGATRARKQPSSKRTRMPFHHPPAVLCAVLSTCVRGYRAVPNLCGRCYALSGTKRARTGVPGGTEREAGLAQGSTACGTTALGPRPPYTLHRHRS